MKPAFGVLADVLAQVADNGGALSDDADAAPGPRGVSGSVGAHVRHCLDHVQALDQALVTRHIDYDARQRGNTIETHRRVALAALETARARLRALDDRWLAEFVEVQTQIAHDGRQVVTRSTIGRELAFVISHTIHHNATLNVLLHRQIAFDRPLGFGYAPSTPCALSA
jgi:uncharacterized damage-inducible protein DinB